MYHLNAHRRWQKLHKSFYNEKKDRFDISKVGSQIKYVT